MKNRLLFCLVTLTLVGLLSSCGGAGSSSVPPPEQPGVPFFIELSPSHFIAQTNALIFLHAKVLDTNGAPMAGVPVTFTNLSEPMGVLQSVLRTLGLAKKKVTFSSVIRNTDSLGIATVSVRSTTDGFVTVQAEINNGAGKVRVTRTVFFASVFPFPNVSSSPSLTLDVDDGDGIFDEPNDFHLFKNSSDNQRIIRATVLDGSGNPVFGATVTFGADSDEATFPLGSTKTTDQNGHAQVIVQVNHDPNIKLPSVLNISASAALPDGRTAFNLISLFLNPVPPITIDLGKSSLTAFPTTVNINGTSTITAVVFDANSGGPVPDGTSVNLTATCGFVNPFTQTTNGVATATFTAPPTPGVCSVTGKVAGVTIGTANITVTTALTVQPASQTINGTVGGTASYTITGGTAPYKVVSNNPSFPATPSVVAASGGTFSVAVPANTTAKSVSYTITDNAGASVTATLTIAGQGSLLVQPSSQTINGNAGGTATVTIFGGNPPYQVFSNNPLYPPAPSTVDSSGSTFTVSVPAGSAAATVTYTILDSIGATTTATVTILATVGPALSVLPGAEAINGFTGGTASYTIFGGSAPYTVISNDPTLPASLSGATFTVTVPPSTPAKAVTYTVRDNAGATVTATLTITAGPALTVLPSSQTITGGTATTVTFTIFGGLAPYSVISNDPTLPGTLDGSGTKFNVDVLASTPAKTVEYTVRDNAGTMVTATLTITPSGGGAPLLVVPATQTLFNPALGATAQYTVTGGSGPYLAFSDNPALATTPSGTFAGPTLTVTVAGAALTNKTATITIYDSLGASVTATLNISVTSAAALTVIPASQTLSNFSAGATAQYSVVGGIGPYKAFSDTPALVTVPSGTFGSSTSGTLTATVAAVPATNATVTIAIYDSTGASISATLILNVTPAKPLTVIPPSQTITNPASLPTSVAYTIVGGVGPFTAFSEAPGFVTVGVSGSTLTATVVVFPPVNTAVKIDVFDSTGATTQVTLNLNPTPLAVNPSAVTMTGLGDLSAANTLTFTITGGKAPYTVFSNAAGVIPSPGSVGAAGTNYATFTVHPPIVFVTQPVTFTVVDSVGAFSTATVTITPLGAISIGLNPSSISVFQGSTIDFGIIAGVPPFKVFSSSTSLLILNGSALNNPLSTGSRSFTGTVSATQTGTVTVTVVDNQGQTAISTVTVNGPPPAPDFSVSCAPTAVNSSSFNSACTLTSVNGYNATVTLSCIPASPTGPGSSCAFSPASLTPTASAILTYTCGGSVGSGVVFNVSATDGTITHTFAMTATCP